MNLITKFRKTKKIYRVFFLVLLVLIAQLSFYVYKSIDGYIKTYQTKQIVQTIPVVQDPYNFVLSFDPGKEMVDTSKFGFKSTSIFGNAGRILSPFYPYTELEVVNRFNLKTVNKYLYTYKDNRWNVFWVNYNGQYYGPYRYGYDISSSIKLPVIEENTALSIFPSSYMMSNPDEALDVINKKIILKSKANNLGRDYRFSTATISDKTIVIKRLYTADDTVGINNNFVHESVDVSSQPHGRYFLVIINSAPLDFDEIDFRDYINIK